MRGYNSSWCAEDDPSAVYAIPGAKIWNPAASTSSSSSSSSTWVRAAAAPEITKFVYTDYTDLSLNDAVKGLSAALAIFIVTTIVMGVLYLRTRQRLKRMEKVRNWMSGKTTGKNGGNIDGSAQSEKRPWDTFTPSPTSPVEGNTKNNGFNSKKSPLATMSSALFLPLSRSNEDLTSSSTPYKSTSTSRATREGLSRLQTRLSDDSRGSAARYSEASTENPFDDDSSSEVLSPDSSTGQRMSRAETTTSEAATIESALTVSPSVSPSIPASRYSTSSSAAPSLQASTVGASSAISDEFWSRTKASTISPITPGSSSGGGSKASLMPFGRY